MLQQLKNALPFNTLPIFDVAVDEQTAGSAMAHLCFYCASAPLNIRCCFTQVPLHSSFKACIKAIGLTKGVCGHWADLGPNEVTQKTLGDLPGANKFDQAAPGTLWCQFHCLQRPSCKVCQRWVAVHGPAHECGMHACGCAGRAGSTSEAPKAGQSVKNAASSVVGDAKSKADQGAGKAKKFFGLF